MKYLSDKNLRKNNKIFLIIVLLAFIIRLPYLSSVPGLQFDEAWYGIRTYEIMKGIIFPYKGMNDYTSPVIEYLRVPFYWIFGINVFSLRLPIVILNILTILYSYLLLKKLYNEKIAFICLDKLSTPIVAANLISFDELGFATIFNFKSSSKEAFLL